MNDLSLHILDLVENSLAAGANEVVVTLAGVGDKKVLVIRDNGRGVQGCSRKLTSPFYTTRSTRKVGLGLALLEHTARLCDGWVKIMPLRPKGAVVVGILARHHWDLPPDGDLTATMLALMAANRHCRFRFNIIRDGQRIAIDSNDFVASSFSEIKRRLALAMKKLGGNEDGTYQDNGRPGKVAKTTAKEPANP